MSSIEDDFKAYIAGLVDSDGNIYCNTSHNKPVVRLNVAQRFGGLLFLCKNKTGVGSVYYSGSYYVWDVTGNQAKDLLFDILPFLVLKKAQAEASLSFLEKQTDKEQVKLARHGLFAQENFSFPWLAGFFDGDGCVTAYKANKKLTISLQTTVDKKDENFCEALAKFYGGACHQNGSNVRWNLKLTHEHEPLLLSLLTHSRLKKQQLQMALKYLKDFPKHARANEEVSNLIKEELSKLKAVETLSEYIVCDVDNYQRWTRGTAAYPKENKLEYLSLGLSSEAGEVCGVVKKVLRDEGGILSEEKRELLVLEISDCLWYCARLADELNVSLADVINANMSKLEDRKERNVIQGSGDDR